MRARILVAVVLLMVDVSVKADRVRYEIDEHGIFVFQFVQNEPKSEISKAVPIYAFKEDVTGRFLKRFCDTVMAQSKDVYRIFEIQNYWKRGLPRKKTVLNIEEEYRFCCPKIYPTLVNGAVIEDCKGIILADNGKIGVLDDDEPEWIENLHLVKTNYSAILEFTIDADFKPKPGVEYVDMIFDDFPVTSLLKIEDNGKVDPWIIQYNSQSVQKTPKIAAAFEWIEEFYRENGLPKGCTYYKQQERSEDVFRTPLYQKWSPIN